MKPCLAATSNDRTPPYAADVGANGWRFALDLDRIQQSDTWQEAPANIRPWLLMLWATAWVQRPAGSLPNRDASIAARIGMTEREFAIHRPELMRGWWLASDGRHYHPVITEFVLAMLDYREKTRARVEKHRSLRNPDVGDDVTRYSRVSNPLVTDSSVGVGVEKRIKTSCANAGAFDAFWSAYPKKKSKGDAEKAWTKIKPNGELVERIMSAMTRAKTCPDWCREGGKFVPYPASWLNAKGWEDDVGSASDPPGMEVL
jgi:hypothetical protein